MPNYLSKVVELIQAQSRRALQSVQMWGTSSSDTLIDVRRSVQVLSSRCGRDVVC
jgi:hypothetical protein